MEVELFTPHIGQKQVITAFADSKHKFGIMASPRQFGKSLLGQNLLLYWLLREPGQKGAWISPIYNQSKKVFQELTNAAHGLISHKNKADLSITFINGSTLLFLSAERFDSIRGFSFTHLVVDEGAFIKEQAINEAILPTLTAIGKKCFIISTPKGKNWFYNYYMRGNQDNETYISFKGNTTDNPYADQEFIAEPGSPLQVAAHNVRFWGRGDGLKPGVLSRPASCLSLAHGIACNFLLHSSLGVNQPLILQPRHVIIKMSIQYVIANIEIPIKIENNISEPLPEYMKINITECKELPEKTSNAAIQSDFTDQILKVVSSNKSEEPVESDIVQNTISKEELEKKKQRKHAHNITFSNNILSHRRTQKKYSNS